MSMNNTKSNQITELERVSKQFLKTNSSHFQSSEIRKLNKKLNGILHEIQYKLSQSTFVSEDCQTIADQIDELIVMTAKLTLKPIHNCEKQVGEVKEKLWNLLEALEEHCKDSFKLSIW